MIKRTIGEIATMVDGTVNHKYNDFIVSGVTIDSRHIEPNNLFVPFKGEHTDGHRFVEQALDSGAAVSFWQKDVPNPPEAPLIFVEDCLTALQQLSRHYLQQVHPKVIGITGSNGKTTTKDMVAAVLSSHFDVKRTIGNYNNEIGLPLTICQLDEDTEISILEMGMSGFGEISFLSELAQPDVAVITNIGESHMRDLGSREGIAQAKFEITHGLNGLLIYDGDEPLLKPLAEKYKGQKIPLGFDTELEHYISDVVTSETGITFKVAPEETAFELPLLGHHNARNAAIAIIIGRHFGLSEETIRFNLQQLKMTGMRMEQIEGPNGSRMINDAYNASPTSMKAAIDTLSQLDGEKFIVLADVLELGPDEERYHREVGQYFNDKPMNVLTTGNAARFIHEEAKQFNPSVHFDTKEEVEEYLRDRLSSESVVLFKASRGMALETIIENLLK